MIIWLKKIASAFDRVNEKVGAAASWLTLLLVGVVCFDVVARKLFNFSKIWIMDLEWHLYSLLFLLAAGYSLKHNRHVRVDLFYENFSKRDKALTDFWGHLLFLIPWCIAVIVFSFGYAMESFRMNEGSPEPGGMPARYLIKFAVTAGAVLLLMQAVSELIKSILILKERKGLNSEQNRDQHGN